MRIGGAPIVLASGSVRPGLANVLFWIFIVTVAPGGFETSSECAVPPPPPLTASITLTWDLSPSPGIAGYRLYYGLLSKHYDLVAAAGTGGQFTMTGLTPGATYYFAATAYDASGQESDYSNEVAVTIPVAPYLKIAMGSQHEALLTGTGLVGASYDVLASQDMQKWTSIGTVTTAVDGTFSFTDWDAALYPARFYRLRQS